MNNTDIKKLFPTLNKGALTAAEYEYASEIVGISTRGLETMIFGVKHTFEKTWQADTDVTLLRKLQSLGTAAQPLLGLHSGVAQVLNGLAQAINLSLPPDKQIAMIDLSVPGTIEWNPDGSVAGFIPTPEPEPEPIPE